MRFAVGRPFLLGLLVGLILHSAASGDGWPVRRGPSHEPEPYRYDPAQIKRAPREFLEDTAACTLYSATTYLVEADGTTETITHEITRLNGRKGVDTLGEHSNITWDPAYQKLILNEARVLKRDGHVVQIEPRHVQLRDINTEYAVYGSEKQLVISFPNLEVGDVYEVKWTTRGKSPEFGEHFFTRYNFGDDRYPVLRDELRVRLPRDKVLKYAPVNGKVEPTIREVGPNRLYLWRVKNRRPLPPDSELPTKEEFRLQLMCSTFPSWDEVGKWKKNLRKECWQCNQAIRDTVREITCCLPSPLEKTRALARWVRRRVRYVSFSSARHGYTPHQPTQVHECLFGDCKDQAQLLAVMLREAGIPAALVTLGMRDDGQVVPEVPSPWGTHAILLVTLDGKDHWIDTTATSAAWDFLPRSDRDRVAYVTDDKGVRVLRTPSLSPADNRYDQATEVWVQPDGTSRCRRSLAYYGLAAIVQRDAWTDAPPGERRRLMTAELQDAHSRARLRRLSVDELTLRDLDEPVRATLEYVIPEHFTGETDRDASFADSRTWGRLVAYNLDFDRSVPMDLWAPFESTHRYTIHLPPGYCFGPLPTEKTVRSRLASFRLKVRRHPTDLHQLTLELHTRLEKGRVDPADFADYLKLHQELTQAWRTWVNITPTRDPADAAALEVVLALAPDDRASALTLARLYQVLGRSADATRVVRQALLFYPRDTGLWDLALSSAGSLEQQEAVYRELTSRFPSDWKYPMAVGRICVSLGRHDAARAVLEPLTRNGEGMVRAQAHFQLARSAMQGKRFAECLKNLQAARAADPGNTFALEWLQLEGHAHAELGQRDQAILAYRQAFLANQENREILPPLIRLETQAGQRDQALDHLRRYTLAVGNDHGGLVQAAAMHLDLGRYEDAFDLAWRAREIGFHAGAQRILGLVYLHQSNFEKAVFHLERSQRDSAVTVGLIRAHLILGNLGRALQHAESVRALAAPSAELRQVCILADQLAQRRQAIVRELKAVPAAKTSACGAAVDALVCAERLHSGGGPADQVNALMHRVFAEGVDIGPAFALRALLALERGRLAPALADAERAIALGPGEARGYFVRGRVLLERGQASALDDLARAAQLTGRRDARVLHWLATALAQQGRHGDALATQREAVKLQPNDRDLQEQLRDLEKATSLGAAAAPGP
jgi:tetratricopeptide (TPR) repeat protein/transglutaminase-like putative cysteine protease